MKYQLIKTLNGQSVVVNTYTSMFAAEHAEQQAAAQATIAHEQTGAPLPKFSIKAVV